MMQNTIAIPAQAPVMVLSGTVLFPNAMLPLRIFEARYRLMLEWALEHDRMFCIALVRPGITEAATSDQFFHTAGIGLISTSVTQPDGTSLIVLQGLARVRFEGFLQSTPFRIAQIQPLPAVVNSPEEAAGLVQQVREKCALMRIDGSPLPASFTELLSRISDPGALADAAAHALIGDAFEQQGLLEEQDITVRLRTIVRLLHERFPNDSSGEAWS